MDTESTTRTEPITQTVANGDARVGDRVTFHGRTGTVAELMWNQSFLDWDLILRFDEPLPGGDSVEERVRPARVELLADEAAPAPDKSKRRSRQKKAAPEPASANGTAEGPPGAPWGDVPHDERYEGSPAEGGAKLSPSKPPPGDPEPNPLVPEPSRFFGRLFIDAPDLAEVGARLIEQHDRFTEHASLRIWYRWKAKTPVSNLTKPIGWTKPVGPEYRDKIPQDVIIWLAADTARAADFGQAQIDAAILHQLCVPSGTVVTGPEVEAASTRWYAGEMIEIGTASGHFLACTPNHPVLTGRGWVTAGLLVEADYVVSSRDPERLSAAVDPHKYQPPMAIEQVARACDVPLTLMPVAAEQLDANRRYHEVDVVAPHGLLLARIPSTPDQHVAELGFVRRHAGAVVLPRPSELRERLLTVMASSPGSVRPGSGAGGPLLGVQEAQALAFSSVSDGHTGALKVPAHRRAADSEGFSERIRGFPGQVAFDEIVHLGRRPFEGHVHNLQTSQSWYSAGGIVVHNCHWERNEKGNWVRRGHDFEGFVLEVAEYGTWTEGLRFAAPAFAEAKASGQLELVMDGSDEEDDDGDGHDDAGTI